MRRFLFLLFPAMGLVSACVFDAPDIDVVSRHDFGAIRKGRIAAADLVVRNVGNAPLDVRYVSTSCGCTKASIEPTMIPAGDEAMLHIAYDSGAHAEDVGKIKRYVFVASNDPDEGDFRIELTMDVTDQ